MKLSWTNSYEEWSSVPKFSYDKQVSVVVDFEAKYKAKWMKKFIEYKLKISIVYWDGKWWC